MNKEKKKEKNWMMKSVENWAKNKGDMKVWSFAIFHDFFLRNININMQISEFMMS